MTNYIHIIGSGHTTYYLQGWEIFIDILSRAGKPWTPCWRIFNLEEHSVVATKETARPETVSSLQLPNGCSNGYTLFLVDSKTLNKIKKYFK
jgi:hypothetical protein